MNERNWVTTLNNNYTFPTLTSIVDIPESDGVEVPVYLDGLNQPYDKFYRKISKPFFNNDSINSFAVNIFTQERIPLVYNPEDVIMIDFPNPMDFMTKNEYYMAIQRWYKYMCTFFSSVQLPIPISGEFYIPLLPKIFTKEERNDPGRYRTFKPNLWPLLPTNYLSMIDMLINHDNIDPNGEFGEIIPKRNPILYKYHITSDEQWQSSLMPKEPDPIIYNNFEEFEDTFIRWASLTYSSIKTPTIPPNQFTKLFGVDIAEQSKEGPRPVLKEAKPTKLNMFSEFTSCLKPNNTNLISNSLVKTLQTLLIRKPHKENVKFSYFGVSSSFQDEMENFGYSTFNDSKPFAIYRPLFYSQKVNIIDDVNIYIVKVSNSTNNYELLLDLASHTVEMGDLDKIMNTSICGTNYAQIIARDKKLLNYILDMDSITQYHSVRVSMILISIFKNDQSYSIMKHISSDMTFFQKLLVNLSTTIDPRISILSMSDRLQAIDCADIFRFYCYSQLLDMITKYCNSGLYKAIIGKCREFSLETAKYLYNNPKYVEDIRNHFPNLRKILFLSGSQQIHRILLGDDFLNWIDINSSFTLIQTIVHNSAMYQASMIFLKNAKNLITSDFITKCGDLTCLFIYQMSCYLIAIGESLSINFYCTNFNDVVNIVGTSKKKSIVSLTAPLTTLLLLTKRNDQEFIDLISKTSSYIGKNISEDVILYLEQIKSLLIFSKNSQCCLSMSKEENLIKRVVGHLIENDLSISHLSWRFFTHITANNDALLQVLSYPYVGSMLASVTTSGNVYALQRMLKFTVISWRKKNPLISGKLCGLLLPAIGRIVCLYKTRHVVFKDNNKVRELIEIFIHQIQVLNKNESGDFVATFNRHMDSNVIKKGFLHNFMNRK
ncbi:hypothetical protein TRFO_21949 [Tritrichomonas foetus]|uniref:Uncharacterized protein n=1 Tax=Tritrichomonas foetus TaxID=1144522 RepID=A0A1J4KE78_9EUKA|nr:hypothetical protein TRFO_21949 [Tritrichomonas foetus]|eukprot:OHT09216.1 hypothetical protein TRFO_21949 [Tritrichomonas foetus]